MSATQSGFPRIGLALSGGGFRASLFHLGVIRRLEELGIMQSVAVVSSVSGGSIIAAYYLVEMERRLRVEQHPFEIATRLKVFESIASDFCRAVEHNLRTRAIIFTPAYYPWLFVKTLFLKAFRSGARAELIQAEYDKWLFNEDTLDQLPSVTANGCFDASNPLVGPKLVLNTTSLLTGKRIVFSRVPKSDVKDFGTPDLNFVRLSRVVGASSGVPVLFPPTSVRGDLLVDGGVADNQGIEALRDEKCDVFLVSDASGQMEVADTLGTGEAVVYSRVNSILQFQIRKKLIGELQALRGSGSEVAFIHLYVNLKDREAEEGGNPIARVSSELVPSLARIRTDLDQFSPIERESLMYHGYTLIDAELSEHCKHLLSRFTPSAMRVAPLFAKPWTSPERGCVREDLEAGREGVFLARCDQKYPWMARPVFALAVGAWLASAAELLHRQAPMLFVAKWLLKTVDSLIPGYLRTALDTLLVRQLNLPKIGPILEGATAFLAFLVVIAIPLYAIAFLTFVVLRYLCGRRDLARYGEIAGRAPSTHWQLPGGTEAELSSVTQMPHQPAWKDEARVAAGGE